jgi:PAS domain S-box-containing protein
MNFQNFKTNSKLSIRILIAVVLCSSILTLFSSMVQLFFDYKKGLNTIHENIHFIQTSYLPSIISGVYTLDEKQIESLLNGCLNFPDIEYLEIIDTSNELYKSAGNKSISKDITQVFSLEYTTPSGKVISVGTLTLFASVKGLYHRLWEKAYIIFFSNMIKTFFAAILIFIIINHIVVRHLINISKFTRNLNLDKLCQKLKLNRKISKTGATDELEQLVQSINLMIDNIKSDADRIKKIQNSLQEREEYLKSILNSAENVAFVITDLSGESTKIIDFSPGAEKIFGYNRNEIIGKKVAILHPPEVVEEFPEMQANLIKSHIGQSGETILVKKSGEHFPALFTLYPKFDNSGNIEGTIGVSIDITERKLAENKLSLSSSRYQNLFQQSPIPLWV